MKRPRKMDFASFADTGQNPEVVTSCTVNGEQYGTRFGTDFLGQVRNQEGDMVVTEWPPKRGRRGTRY